MSKRTVQELRATARARGLVGYSKLRKEDLLRLLAGKRNSKRAKPKARPPAAAGASRKRASVKVSPAKKKRTSRLAAKKRAVKLAKPRALSEPAPQVRTRTPAASANQERIEDAKYSTTLPDLELTLPFLSVDLGEDIENLPPLPEPLLGLLPQKPGILHGYWALEPGSMKRQPGLCIRLCRIRDRVLEVLDEIPLPSESGSWYFHLGELPADTELYVQLGYYAHDGAFVGTLRRGIARVPSRNASARTDSEWWISETDFRRMYVRSGGRIENATPVWSASVSSR